MIFVSKNFQRGGKNCVLSVHTNFLERNVFFEKKIYFGFQIVSKNSAKINFHFDKDFPMGLPTQHSKSS